MTCKRCGCTETTPCVREGQPCAWMLPDLCTACLTPEEAAIDRQYAGIIEGLRAELEQDRFERYLLAIAQGMAANPAVQIESCRPEDFVVRAFDLATGLSEAASADDDQDDNDTDRPRIVQP